MAFFFLDKYYKEWFEVELYCQDPIVCIKEKIRLLYKERLPYLNIQDFDKCIAIDKVIRRCNALIKRLEEGMWIKYKFEEDGAVILVKLDDFYNNSVRWDETQKLGEE